MPRITRLISDYGKAGKWGCIIGSLIGVLVIWPMINYTEAISSKVLILVTGLVVLPFLLAYIGESVARRSFPTLFSPVSCRFFYLSDRHTFKTFSLFVLHLHRV